MLYKSARLTALIAILLTGLMMTQAATANFSGALTASDATWIRPVILGGFEAVAPCTGAIAISDHYYDTIDFYVDTTGTYDFRLASPDFDEYLLLYGEGAPFTGNGTDPCLVSNDDAAFDTVESGFSYNLQANQTYTAVVTTYSSNSTGNYTLTIDGVGTILSGEAPVEEAPSEEDTEIPYFEFTDGRLNNRDLATPIVIYLQPYADGVGLNIYAPDGRLLLVLTPEQATAAGDCPTENTLLASSDIADVRVYRLTSCEWQINAGMDELKQYVIRFNELTPGAYFSTEEYWVD